jgi:hypothetical protein
MLDFKNGKSDEIKNENLVSTVSWVVKVLE